MWRWGYGWFSWGVASLPESKSEFLPLVLKDKRSCFSQGERFVVQLPLDRVLALRKWDAYLTFGNYLYQSHMTVMHNDYKWKQALLYTYIRCYTSVSGSQLKYTQYSVPLFTFIWRQSGPRLEPLRPGRAGWNGIGFLQDCDNIIRWNDCYLETCKSLNWILVTLKSTLNKMMQTVTIKSDATTNC